jgi:hypothetical protein
MDLGLGLGAPHAVRRIGRGVAGRNEVVLLPVNWGRGMWEVQVELEESVMRALAGDGGLRAWLWGAVGRKLHPLMSVGVLLTYNSYCHVMVVSATSVGRVTLYASERAVR